jgi:pimeloyl-ACP methyl ester carboxylesterase
MPVLAVGGAASRGDGAAMDVGRIAHDVTGLTVPDCGHYVPEEAPGALLAALDALLA